MLSISARGTSPTVGGGDDAPIPRKTASLFGKIMGALSSGTGSTTNEAATDENVPMNVPMNAAAASFPVNIRPRWAFCGELYIVDSSTSPSDERRALRRLLDDAATAPLVPDAEGCIGVDTETRVKNLYNRDRIYRTTLLQLSSLNTCVIYRLSDIREEEQPGAKRKGRSSISTQLSSLLGNRKIIKVGIGVMNDMGNLAWEEKNLPRVESVVELNAIALSVPSLQRKQPWGLKSLAEELSPSRGLVQKNRKITVSDWALPLSHDHIVYAATDAWLGVELAHLLVERMDAEKNSNRDDDDDDDVVRLRDLQPQRVFEGYLGVERWESKVRSICSEHQYSRPLNSKARNAEVLRKPKSMPHEDYTERLHRFMLDKKECLLILDQVREPSTRAFIYMAQRRHDDLFKFSYVSSKDAHLSRQGKGESKSIVIFRPVSPKWAAMLKQSIELVRKFSLSVWHTNEDQKTSIRMPNPSMWKNCFRGRRQRIRYPTPNFESRHISECLVHYEANQVLHRMYKKQQKFSPDEKMDTKLQIQCRLNSGKIMMDVWSERVRC